MIEFIKIPTPAQMGAQEYISGDASPRPDATIVNGIVRRLTAMLCDQPVKTPFDLDRICTMEKWPGKPELDASWAQVVQLFLEAGWDLYGSVMVPDDIAIQPSVRVHKLRPVTPIDTGDAQLNRVLSLLVSEIEIVKEDLEALRGIEGVKREDLEMDKAARRGRKRALESIKRAVVEIAKGR